MSFLNQKQTHKELSAKLDEVYFAHIRKEINDRIKIHYDLSKFKYIAVGGILSFLISSNMIVSAYIVGAIISFLFDLLVLGNLRWLKSAGEYTKNKIENNSKLELIVKWETGNTQSDGKWQCFSFSEYMLSSWGIGIGLLTLSIFVK